MKRLTFAVCVLILTFGVGTYAAKPGPPNPCSGETPLSWSFMDTLSAPAAFSSDGGGAYQQNVGGVSNSLLQSEDFSATIAFPGPGGRSIRVLIPAHIPGSIINKGPAPFAGGASFLSGGQMNIRNIVGSPYPAPIYPATFTFYTKASGRFTGTDGKAYQWRAMPDDFTCPTGSICVPNLHSGADDGLSNVPAQTGWVKVTYMPRDRSQAYSATSNADKWLVEGEFVEASGVIQRTTLVSLGKGNSGGHYGQYSMPFKILITTLCPLP